MNVSQRLFLLKLSYQVGINSMPRELADVEFIATLANQIFVPLLRSLHGKQCIQSLELLAKRYHNGILLSAQTPEWMQPIESWLWERAFHSVETDDPQLAFQVRKKVRLLPCHSTSSHPLTQTQRSYLIQVNKFLFMIILLFLPRI